MHTQSSLIKPGSNADLAFTVVVLASYFATFAAIRQATIFDILLMIVLGLAYILMGIYGYAYCAHSGLPVLRIGYFLIQIPLGGLIVSLGKGAGFNALLLLPLAGHAVVLLDEFFVYLANAGILGIYVVSIGSYSSWDAVWSGLPTFLAGLLFILVFTQSSISEGQARREVERLVGELQEANQQLREYAVQAEELAVTRERNRLAREIHDGLGHYLTTVHMEIQAARAVMDRDPGRAKQMLDKAQILTQDALTDVRSSVAALRASPDENLPLPEMVDKLLKNCSAMNLETDLRIVGTPHSLSPQVYLTLFRAAQEAISNICKHSKATQVWVQLDYLTAGEIRLMVQDNGIGAEQIEGGFGLLGVRERINLLNGKFTIRTAINEGFRLEIMVPE
jgi:signal transduction histidine kinase